MTELQAIARLLRRPEEDLRAPFELIRQGYDPEFLATYRKDETGGMDREIMVRIKRAMNYHRKLQFHRDAIQKVLEQENLWSSSVAEAVGRADRIAEIDLITRGLRSKKGTRSFSDRTGVIAKLAEAILTMQGEAPADLDAWTADRVQQLVPDQPRPTPEESQALLGQVRRWLQLLLHEEVAFMDRLSRQLRRRCLISVELLQNDPQNQDGAAEASLEPPTDANPASTESAETEPQNQLPTPEIITESLDQENAGEVPASPSVTETAVAPLPSEPVSTETTDTIDSALSEQPATADASTESVDPEATNSTESDQPADVANLTFNAPKRGKRGKKEKGKENTKDSRRPRSETLSPRQRRRRWLRGMLEAYAKLRRPIDRLTPYQILMLAKGQRSLLIKLHFQYDRGPLVQLARESLCPGRHPLHHWLLQTVEQALDEFILPKLEQDLLAEYEEGAQLELLDCAASHLESALVQRPLRNVPILVIDAIGPKATAVAILDTHGDVLHTDEVLCNSARSDVMSNTVMKLGEWIHQYKIPLIAISNGPNRRYLIHAVKELLKQSNATEARLWWTMVDRTGADAYASTQLCLKELPSISRRHRSAVWLGRRLQDPLHELLKINPSHLRLGSYQRELPDEPLQQCLDEVVSSVVSRKGIDTVHASERTLRHLPGVSPEIAKAIVDLREQQGLSSRQAMWEHLKDAWPEFQYRQAIPSLRLFGVEEALDATAIHPEDYRMAQRLIANAGMPTPANCPDGWVKRQAIPDAPSQTDPGMDPESTSETAEHSETLEAVESPNAEELHAATGAESPDVESPDVESITVASDASAALAGESTSTTEEMAASIDSVSSSTESLVEATAGSSDFAEASSESADDVVDQVDASTSPASDVDPSASSNEATEIVGDAAVTDASATAETVSAEVATDPVAVATVRPLQEAPFIKPKLAHAALAIDVEKLARGWQVGRGRLRYVAHCLQHPFVDFRDFGFTPPVLDRVPSIEDLRPGMSLWAVVNGVADFGAFADLGPDCSGLIHISRLSRHEVEDPHQAVQIGDLVQVWVVDVDPVKRRVSLSALPPGVQPIRLREYADQEEGRRQGGPGGRDQRDGRDGNQRRGQRPDGRAQGQGQGQGQGQSQGRGGGGRPGSNDPRGGRSDAGQRSGTRDGGGNRGRGGPGGGPDRGRGGGRGSDRGGQRGGRQRDREGYSADQEQFRDTSERKVKIHQPAKPITDAMQDGREPLRSFSDLMQFYQVKREPEPHVVQETGETPVDAQANPSEE